MKKLIVLLAATCLLATGCVQMHMDTIVKDDGSGTMSMSYSMTATVAEAVAELAEIPGSDADDAPMLDDFDEDAMKKACKKHGCELKEFSGTDTEIAFTIAFESLENLSKALVDGQSGGGSGGFALFKTADGNYTISDYEYEGEAVDGPAEEAVEEKPMDPSEMNPEDMQKSMAIMGKLMGAMAELDVQMKITVPGDIITHNAHRVEGRTMIWEINSSNFMEASSGMEPEVVFSGEGLDIEAPPAE